MNRMPPAVEMDVVEEPSGPRRRQPRRHPILKCRRKPSAATCGVDGLRTIHGAYRPHRRRFTSGHPRSQQPRHRDRRDDADDSHHDQQLDQRESGLVGRLHDAPRKPPASRRPKRSPAASLSRGPCLRELSHSTLAEEGGHVIRPESRSDVQRHAMSRISQRRVDIISCPGGHRLHRTARTSAFSGVDALARIIRKGSDFGSQDGVIVSRTKDRTLPLSSAGHVGRKIGRMARCERPAGQLRRGRSREAR